MTDPISSSPYFKKQRECLWCHAGIAEQRPVFLVQSVDGRILGPFHAGCAARLKLAERKRPTLDSLGNPVQYGTWPISREETLPE